MTSGFVFFVSCAVRKREMNLILETLDSITVCYFLYACESHDLGSDEWSLFSILIIVAKSLK